MPALSAASPAAAPRPHVWTIVVAAGGATRFGRPKQYEMLDGARVLDWALRSARRVSEGVVLVVAPEAAGAPEPAADVVVVGGATRSGSVRAGLAAVPADCEVVLVHDAARPLASIELFEAVLGAVLGGAAAAVPGLPLVDTVKRLGVAGTVAETVDRSDLVAVQTPQGFRAPALRQAHQGAPEATDDAGLIEALGGEVVVVPGERANLKITEPHDLVVLAALVADRRQLQGERS